VNPAPDISITFANNPPTLSANSLLPGTQPNQPLTFSFADLKTLMNDWDNDVTSVVIATILQGTLLKNGIQVEPGTILEPGDILVYIPPLDASGQLNALRSQLATKFPLQNHY
jgi:hypothetical protein